MRLLHVLVSLEQSSGGPLRAVLDLSARSFEYGLHSEIVGIGPLNISDNPFPTAFIHSLPASPRNYAYCSSLRPWLRERLHDFDGVVIHGMWQYPCWAAAEECRQARKPYACFPHGMLEPWSFFGQGLFKAAKKVLYWQWREAGILQKACHIFFTTSREMTLAQETFSLKPCQSLLAPNGALPHVTQVEAPSNREIVCPKDRKVALFLGRVHPKKNVEFLIRSWAKAAPPSQWNLIIAGPGEAAYIASLRSLVQKLQLSGNVHFVGYVHGEDKSYLLQRADWFLLPSLQENFGIAVLEAINSGCPVIISDQVYVGDYFAGYEGILRLDEDVWARFMNSRMLDCNFREDAAKHLRSIVDSRFSIDYIAHQWATRLMQIFSTAQPTARGADRSSGLGVRGMLRGVRKYSSCHH